MNSLARDRTSNDEPDLEAEDEDGIGAFRRKPLHALVEEVLTDFLEETFPTPPPFETASGLGLLQQEIPVAVVPKPTDEPAHALTEPRQDSTLPAPQVPADSKPTERSELLSTGASSQPVLSARTASDRTALDVDLATAPSADATAVEPEQQLPRVPPLRAPASVPFASFTPRLVGGFAPPLLASCGKTPLPIVARVGELDGTTFADWDVSYMQSPDVWKVAPKLPAVPSAILAINCSGEPVAVTIGWPFPTSRFAQFPAGRPDGELTVHTLLFDFA